MKRKEYISPEIVVIELQQRAQLLYGSRRTRSLRDNEEEIYWDGDGIEDDEDDR